MAATEIARKFFSTKVLLLQISFGFCRSYQPEAHSPPAVVANSIALQSFNHRGHKASRRKCETVVTFFAPPDSEPVPASSPLFRRNCLTLSAPRSPTHLPCAEIRQRQTAPDTLLSVPPYLFPQSSPVVRRFVSHRARRRQFEMPSQWTVQMPATSLLRHLLPRHIARRSPGSP